MCNDVIENLFASIVKSKIKYLDQVVKVREASTKLIGCILCEQVTGTGAYSENHSTLADTKKLFENECLQLDRDERRYQDLNIKGKQILLQQEGNKILFTVIDETNGRISKIFNASLSGERVIIEAISQNLL